MWTIYEKPLDFPNGYVVRRFRIGASLDGEPQPLEAYSFPTLANARESVPPGRFRVHRSPDDDPVILEVWI